MIKRATSLADATVRVKQGVKGGSSIPKQPPSSSDKSIDQVAASASVGQSSDDGLNQPVSELSSDPENLLHPRLHHTRAKAL
jgi:hypothetical protein